MRHPDSTVPERSEGRGPVRYGPPLPEPGLPVLPELAAVVASTAGRSHPEPPGGPPALLEAARGHWQRRGLAPERAQVTAAPGGAPLLLALTAALGGDVLVPRPCPAWWGPQARLLGRDVFSVPTPAECGGVPDPYALLETVRRVRAEGGDPRLLVVSVADDPTATVPPPEVLHEAVEAAAGEGLHVVSDETWRDTVHPGAGGTVLFSPAEMFPALVTVLTDLTGAYLPPSLPAACARFPPTAEGDRLAARVLDVLTATGAGLSAPVAAAATYVLDEGEEVTARRSAAVALHGRVAAALHRIVLAAGGVARPPAAGRHLYVDLERLRPRLSARGVTDAQDLEDFLGDRLGMPAPGGHRFGDDLGALRVRLCTGPLIGSTPDERRASLTSPEPLELPHVARVLSMVESVFGDLCELGDRAGPEGTGAAGEGWESER
ncbi:aminotransferase class I/II-fold pyridoxal phosphate-dependent enzyme [Streptomyces sp. SID8379]|uniref:aminotransferase class I/II-fold pyridoxal phosphate-dependent enzyme n=1 Tax=unclassified Streptomyces TaxID=2593676 RepID=UPI000370EC74|nr:MULTISPECIES: aminotransferase class I/II-fold pyridoxal phosphate-dependent enzyme [unclassified Streptomyces]MYW62637.1 aminotransferase class I/II-fold pyridoxal phosphate-dependent enzyme [Streptomyces sp. SID8379]